MTLLNPWGFLALLAIPLVLLIHFFQRQAKVLPVSTLFLLQQSRQESSTGQRFERLTNSLPLWLQLLAVLFITWLLIEPRFQRADSTQQVAIVLDSSASMSVFKDRLHDELAELLPQFQGEAASLQLYLFESDSQKPTLYRGESVDELLASLDSWQPTSGLIDPYSALRLARSRIRKDGLLLYATDHSLSPQTNLPFSSQLLAVGAPLPNIGFSGLSFGTSNTQWQATVKNYSNDPANTQWWVQYPDGSASEKRSLSLSPNGLQTLSGTFPGDAQQLTVHLSPDAFTLDDQLPIVQPQSKSVRINTTLPKTYHNFRKRLFSSLPQIETARSADEADLTIQTYDPLQPTFPNTNAIIFINETTRSRTVLSGNLITEPHPLVANLNWQPLQVRETVPMPLENTDEVLLWQGDRPLIALRQIADRSSAQLIFNFDLTQSNAGKLPATVILLHRFVTTILTSKIDFEARNLELNQPLTLAHLPQAQLTHHTETTSQTLDTAKPLANLKEPGFFEIRQNDTPLLRAGVHFADSREADFSKAQSIRKIDRNTSQAVAQNTSEDRFWPLWLSLLAIALLSSWYAIQKKNSEYDLHSSKAVSR